MVSTSQFLLAVAGVGVGVIILDAVRVPREIRKGSTLLHLVGMAEVGGLAIALNFLTETGKRSMVSTFKRLLPSLAKAKAGVEPDENYISRLPDDILCHIISYLDKKDAAQAFVLSRRWRRIYYILLPNPKFECHKMIEFATLTEHNNCHRMDKQRFVASVYDMSELLVSLMMHRNCHCNDKQRFATAVDSFLCLRTGIPMESLTLRFGLRRGFSGHLRRWLDCIVRSGVRKLETDFRCVYELFGIPFSQLIVFPFMVLSSASTLECVRLSFCILELNFEGPFNSLKELKLSRVPLDNWEVETILSCCPQLNSLELVCCKLPSKLHVTALELRTLHIKNCEQVNQIGFSTPNLDYFCYRDNCGLSFFPSYVPNLRTFYVDLICHKRPSQGIGGFVSFAPCLSTLWIQATPHQVQDIQKEMPKLSNLEGLSLHVIGGSLDLRDIASLIAVCPNISTFELSCHDCWLSYTEVPLTCVNLKTVWLDGFKFDAAQMKFASQLVRCAPTLQNMRMCTAYCFYPEGKNVEKTLPRKRREFPDELINRTKQLLELEASSPSAVVRITHDFSTPHVPTQHLT